MIPSNVIQQQANGLWPLILETLGINAIYLKNKHGACPVCGGRDRWRFDNKEGRGTYFCNKCGSGDGLQLLQLFHGWSFPVTLKMVADVLGISESHPFKTK